MSDDTTPVRSTIPSDGTTPVSCTISMEANPPELNDARLDRLNIDTMYVGHIQSAVLWHIEAKIDLCAPMEELEGVVVAASNADEMSKAVSGFGRRVIEKMVSTGILAQVVVEDEYGCPSAVALGVGDRGCAALRHLTSRGIFNPYLTETNND